MMMMMVVMMKVNMADSAKLTKQTDSLAAKQTVPVVCVSDDLKRGEA